ncbi:MAG TPA: hypothetical protein VK590_05905, partial [Saprospiraceae bacterium]|nr:hypothetical protein [Saprospiraceae bacterium]
MEENRDIDSLFKSSLEKFDMVPSVDLWSSLDIELTRKLEARLKKRNRRLLLLCFLLVLIPGTAYYLIHNLNKQNKQNLVEYKIEAAKAEKIEKAPLVKKYENANAIWDNKALNSNKSSSVSNSSFNGQQANSKATQHSSNRTNQRFEHARHSIKLQTVSKNNLDSKR